MDISMMTLSWILSVGLAFGVVAPIGFSARSPLELGTDLAMVNSRSSALAIAPSTIFTEAQQTILNDLESASVIYLGETHDRQADHQAQLAIIQELHQRNPQLAIALEMVQQPYQTVLDQYLAGEISETELREQSEYDQRWGYDWELYAPIFRYAQAEQLSLIALNTPTELTREVARQGEDAWTTVDSKWLIPRSELDTHNDAYRNRLRPIYDEIHQGQSASFSFEHFMLAQLLWDETMAAAIASFLQENQEFQIVVLAGQGHIVYGDGIPDRVARRMADNPDFQQRSLLLNPSENAETVGEGVIADYFWFSDPANRSTP